MALRSCVVWCGCVLCCVCGVVWCGAVRCGGVALVKVCIFHNQKMHFYFMLCYCIYPCIDATVGYLLIELCNGRPVFKFYRRKWSTPFCWRTYSTSFQVAEKTGRLSTSSHFCRPVLQLECQLMFCWRSIWLLAKSNPRLGTRFSKKSNFERRQRSKAWKNHSVIRATWDLNFQNDAKKEEANN